MSKSNIEILAYEPSPLGLLCLRRRELLSQPGMIADQNPNYDLFFKMV